MPRSFLSCLFGSERQRSKSHTFAGFLSCLFGSELGPAGLRSVRLFLSCLFGSEHSSDREIA